jgi:hypothetical protein
MPATEFVDPGQPTSRGLGLRSQQISGQGLFGLPISSFILSSQSIQAFLTLWILDRGLFGSTADELLGLFIHEMNVTTFDTAREQNAISVLHQIQEFGWARVKNYELGLRKLG